MKRLQLLCALTLVSLVSCTPGPPYNWYDGPPSFAIRYLPPYTGFPQMWSTLEGYHVRDEPYGEWPFSHGAERAFTLRVSFNNWFKVPSGRWPAVWHIGVWSGCGEPTSIDALIKQKLETFQCIVQQNNGGTTLQVAPGTVYSGTPPPTMQVTGDGLAGQSKTAYIVDPASESLVWEGQVTFDGAGNISVPTPAVAEGTYYVALDDGSLGSYAVVSGSASGRWKLDGSGGCYWDQYDNGGDQCSPPPPSGRWKLDGNGGCYWDQWDSGPDQCQGGVTVSARNTGRKPLPMRANVAGRKGGAGQFISLENAPANRTRHSGSVGKGQSR